jgi:hypothetical protein
MTGPWLSSPNVMLRVIFEMFCYWSEPPFLHVRSCLHVSIVACCAYFTSSVMYLTRGSIVCASMNEFVFKVEACSVHLYSCAFYMVGISL